MGAQIDNTIQPNINVSKKCPKCLALNPVLAVYCMKCGARFEEVEEKEAEKARIEHHPNYLWNGQLYESVLTPEGTSAFLTYKDGEGFKIVPELTVTDDEGKPVKIRPVSSKALPYRQYTLTDDWNKPVDLGKSWVAVLEFIRKRVVAPWEYLKLFAFDIFLSYLQDSFSAVHYIFLVGDTESGKSRVMDVFKMLGFRPLASVLLPTADIYEYLGRNSDLTRGIVLEDEADDLITDGDKRRLWKAGYKRGAFVPRIAIAERTGAREQIFFNVYCFKMAMSEKLPEGGRAKGLLERCIILNMVHGIPEKMDLGVEDWEEAQRIKNELLKMRLQYFGKVMLEPEYYVPVILDEEKRMVRLKGRDRELFAPILAIGKLIGRVEDAESVVSYFLTQRLKVKRQVAEYFLAKTLMRMVESEQRARTGEQIKYIEFTPIEGFEALKETVGGEIDETGEKLKSPLLEGTITLQFFGRRIAEIFKGERTIEKRGGRTVRVWRVPVESIRAVLSKYDWFEEIKEAGEIHPPIEEAPISQAPLEKAPIFQASILERGEKTEGLPYLRPSQAPMPEQAEKIEKVTEVTEVTDIPGCRGVTEVTTEIPPAKEYSISEKEEVKEPLHPQESVTSVTSVTLPKEARESVTFQKEPEKTPVSLEEAQKEAKPLSLEELLHLRAYAEKWAEACDLALFVYIKKMIFGEINTVSFQEIDAFASKILADEKLYNEVKNEMKMETEGLKWCFPVYKAYVRFKQGRYLPEVRVSYEDLTRAFSILEARFEREKYRRQLWQSQPVKASILTSELYPTEKCFFCGSMPIFAQLTFENDWVLVCSKCLDEFKARFSFPIEDVRGWRKKKKAAS